MDLNTLEQLLRGTVISNNNWKGSSSVVKKLFAS